MCPAAGRTHTGEFTALIGPSGAGKTTLMDCIALRQRKFVGAIHLDGASPKGDYFTQTGTSSRKCLSSLYTFVGQTFAFQGSYPEVPPCSEGGCADRILFLRNVPCGCV